MKKILSVFLIGSIPFLYGYFLFYTFNYQITHTGLPSAAAISMADQHASGVFEHDGLERNVLLVMFLMVGPLGFLLYKTRVAPKFLAGLGVILWLIFLLEMHFFANLFANTLSWDKLKVWGIIISGFTFLVLLWRWLYPRNLFLARLLIAETLIACCFVPFTDLSFYDYSFIMAPALKVLQCGKISAAYFQYDILPSIPAFFIVKHGGTAYHYRLVAQLSMFVFFAACFIMARRFFVYKNLAFLLLALMLIVRLFMGLNEVTDAPQVVSLRLDWWLLLFAIAYFSGLGSYWLGICLMLLLVLLNSFGIIYLFCYLALTGFLLLFQFYNNYMQDGTLPRMDVITTWIKTYLPNAVLGFAGFLLHWLITGDFISESVTIYKDFQLGMLPVLQDSLYWYFGAVFAFCFVLLLVFKDRFNPRYLNASFMLLFLFVGNSIYFFGRSHENNIINISGSLIFVVFLCCDIILQQLSRGQPLSLVQKITGLVPFAFIFLVLLMADANMFAVQTKLYATYVHERFPEYTETFPQPADLAVVADITHHSKKVFFMTYSGADFFLYYRGGYDIPSKIVPLDAWMLKSEKIAYANQLISQGYYVVAVAEDAIFKNEFLPKMHFKNTYAENVYVAYSNE